MLQNKYYFVDGKVCKVMHISPATDEVILFDLTSQELRKVSFYGVKLISEPAFKIGEVAKMLGKKSDTIRKWEYRELIPEQPQWQVSEKKFLRFYTSKDVEGIRDMIEYIHVGRPRKDKLTSNPIPSQGLLKQYIRERVRTYGK